MRRIFVWIIMIGGGAALGLYLDTILFKNIHISFVFHSISFVIGFLLLILVVKISKNTGRTLAKYGRKGNIQRMETNILNIKIKCPGFVLRLNAWKNFLEVL